MTCHQYMIKKSSASLHWVEFELFSKIPGLVHGTFSRLGGVSSPPFHSLNVGLSVGDDPECVAKNLSAVQRSLGLSSLLPMTQVHEDSILLASSLLSPCDGLVTSKRGVGLLVQHADCQAALFYDPIHRAVAAVHAGWRGLVKQIYKKALHALAFHFGTKPQDVLVGISPSLGPNCAQFLHYQTEFPKALWRFQHTPFHFNLWEASRFQLEESGVLPSHIEIAGICTYSHPEEYFSYRRQKITGRNATVIGLL